jgi:hypothetical protein
VYLYGGHVTSWKDEHGDELLFVSNKVLLFFCLHNLPVVYQLYGTFFWGVGGWGE